MWSYNQSTGLISRNDKPVWHGYSGHDKGLNDPDYEKIEGVGPIPAGLWYIGPPHDSPHTGPYTLTLTPDKTTNTFGRTDFRIHGDNYHLDKSASHGCIIVARAVRESMHESYDNELTVASGR